MTTFHRKGIKENKNMKRSELKGIIKEVVRLCIKESGAGAAYKVRRNTQVERPGLINRAREMQHNPDVNENYRKKLCRGCEEEYEVSDLNKRGLCPGCRYDQRGDYDDIDHSVYREPYGRERQPGDPSRWPGDLEEGGDVPAPVAAAPAAPAGEEQPYDEQDEIRLIKAVGKAIVKLLQMHKGMETPEGGVQAESLIRKIYKQLKEAGAGAAYKIRKDTQVERPGLVNRARKMQNDPEVNESNHKVQQRSYKTIGDVSQNPENLRDPAVPPT